MIPITRNFMTARATAFAFLAIGFAGCSVVATRPVQEMSDTGAAIKAAREVQADTLSPELYRRANEWFNKARREYKFKNFKEAKDSANKARHYAEQAEYEAIRNNGVRSETPDEVAPAKPEPVATPSHYDYPVPTGTPADVYDQRKKEEEAAKAPPTPATPGAAPGATPTPIPIQVPTP